MLKLMLSGQSGTTNPNGKVLTPIPPFSAKQHQEKPFHLKMQITGILYLYPVRNQILLFNTTSFPANVHAQVSVFGINGSFQNKHGEFLELS